LNADLQTFQLNNTAPTFVAFSVLITTTFSEQTTERKDSTSNKKPRQRQKQLQFKPTFVIFKNFHN
jgi:hypothetical protein